LGTLNLFNSNRDLFEQVCAEDNLLLAFLDVKSNKGAAGVDGITIEVFETQVLEELAALAKELREWRYKPRPVKRVEIPKADGNGVRNLGIPCIRDRIVQACLKIVLEPLFEPTFSKSSYGFRPGRRQQDAIAVAQQYVQAGKEWVVDIDLEKFFDTLSQDRLIYRLSLKVTDKRILRLVGMCLRSGVIIDGRKHPTTEGSVQGSPLSPLLSNVVLDELDKELEKRGLAFVRWADDSNIFVGSEKAANRVMTSITKFIELKLKLRINRTKSKVALSKYVKFLGMTIVAGTVAIAAKAMASAMDKVSKLVRTNSPVPVEKSIAKVNEWYVGWANYFAMTQYPIQLLMIEAHVRRRLRARIVRQTKRRNTLYKRLVSRGVKRKTASKNVFSNKGPWKLSVGSMNLAYSVEWFIKIAGQKVCSNRKRPHWFSVQKRILLT
jgi:RNA-directed DNA polymerase